MFNDSICMLLTYWSLLEAMKGRWFRATTAYTLSLSVKLNPIYYAPAFAIIIWKYNGLK